MQQDEGNIQSGTTASNGRGCIIIISGWILISNLHCYTGHDCFAALMKNEHWQHLTLRFTSKMHSTGLVT